MCVCVYANDYVYIYIYIYIYIINKLIHFISDGLFLDGTRVTHFNVNFSKLSLREVKMKNIV